MVALMGTETLHPCFFQPVQSSLYNDILMNMVILHRMKYNAVKIFHYFLCFVTQITANSTVLYIQ